jgi:hypothetical protein
MLFSFTIVKLNTAQILCVQCFDQNDSIGVGVGANNFIANGNFENTTCAFNSNANTFCPNSANYNCNIANWICTGGGSSTYTCFYDSTVWYVEQGSHSVYFGNNFCSACPLGDTTCLINNGCTVTGIPAGYPLSNGAAYGDTLGVSLSQAVSGLTPGSVYILEFWAGGESDGLGTFTGKGLFAVDLGFGNTFLRCKPTEPHTGVGTRFLIQFKATSTTHTVKFTNWGHISFSATELILDNVRLYTPNHLPPTISSCASAINEEEGNTVSVFPNPATNQLTIESSSYEAESIKIYNVLGEMILQAAITKLQSTINIESLAKGIYIYEVKNKKGVMKGKVVKN